MSSYLTLDLVREGVCGLCKAHAMRAQGHDRLHGIARGHLGNVCFYEPAVDKHAYRHVMMRP